MAHGSAWSSSPLIVAGVVVFGVTARRGAEHALEKETAVAAIPSVNVVYPAPSTLSSEIALPGNTQAFTDTPIYSRTNGYLKNWYFDIGAHVRKGQLMAQIETPEVDQQLQVAQADLKSAQANLDLANTTSSRYQNLLKTNSVSKQETDVAMSDAAAKKAAVDASMANVRRLEQLQSFEKVYAPFDGIVTARNTDIGATDLGRPEYDAAGAVPPGGHREDQGLRCGPGGLLLCHQDRRQSDADARRVSRQVV